MNEQHILRCTKYVAISEPEKGLYQFLHGYLVKFGSHLALVDVRSGKEFSYSEVASLVERVAYHLYRRGVRRGDVFAFCAPNSVTYVILILALARLGAVFALVNGLNSIDELINCLSLAGAKYLYTSEAHPDDAGRIMSNTPVKVVFTEDKSAASLLEPVPSGETVPSTETVSPQDVSAILFSSGTSGLPKAVEMTDRSVLSICLSCSAFGAGATTQGEACLIGQLLSRFSGFGLVISSMICGAYSVIMSGFDFKLYLELVAKHKVRNLIMPPSVMLLLAKNQLVAQYDLSSIETILVGAAPVSAELEQQTRARLGNHVCIRQAYGMTEAGMCTVSPPKAKQTHPVPPGTAGCVAPNTQIKIVSLTTGTVSGPNQTGELRVKSDQVMKGYRGNESATREAFDEEGWLKTGDVGYYDEKEYVFIVDRFKELIRYDAYHVAPAELEGVLLNHPDVLDVGVIGLPDESRGELPHAWVVRKPGSSVTEQDIIDFVSDKVAPFKKLRGGVRFVSQIPKSPSGKILRRQIRNEMAAPSSAKP